MKTRFCVAFQAHGEVTGNNGDRDPALQPIQYLLGLINETTHVCRGVSWCWCSVSVC